MGRRPRRPRSARRRCRGASATRRRALERPGPGRRGRKLVAFLKMSSPWRSPRALATVQPHVDGAGGYLRRVFSSKRHAARTGEAPLYGNVAARAAVRDLPEINLIRPQSRRALRPARGPAAPRARSPARPRVVPRTMSAPAKLRNVFFASDQAQQFASTRQPRPSNAFLSIARPSLRMPRCAPPAQDRPTKMTDGLYPSPSRSSS